MYLAVLLIKDSRSHFYYILNYMYTQHPSQSSIFIEGGKLGVPGEKPLKQGREQTNMKHPAQELNQASQLSSVKGVSSHYSTTHGSLMFLSLYFI